MKKIAVIVAGGVGTRMGTDIPKQFLLLNSMPVLMHTISVFYNYESSMQIILVLPENQFDYWQNLCSEYHFKIPHTLVKGGEQRFFSVKNALDAIHDNEAIVAIHDGVRPLVSFKTIENCFSKAFADGNAIPVIDVFESIRQIEQDSSTSVNRNNYKLVQTPQVFLFSQIKKAYSQPYSALFTDDASVTESAGNKVHLVEGNRENIKITTAIDLVIAEALIKRF